jgi:hypothetical protein
MLNNTTFLQVVDKNFYEESQMENHSTLLCLLLPEQPLTKPKEGYDSGMKRIRFPFAPSEMPIIPVKINEHILSALIDTGASMTLIRDTKVKDFGLLPNDKKCFISTAVKDVSTEALGYGVKFNWINIDKISFTNTGFPITIFGIPFPPDRTKYDVILGRDILNYTELKIDGLISREIDILVREFGDK